jgi:NhaP-type Na+/H+ or K+/H+ antiporter
VESGLNDGIMVPVLLILISCAEAVEQASPAGYWIRFTLLQVTVGPAIGVAVGYIGGKMVTASTRTGWMNDSFQRLSAIGLALAAYSIASVAGGNGFIAAFCAGLALGNSARHVCGRLYEFSEAEGQLLTLLVFMVFGVAMLPVAIDGVSWETVLYALLSLTAIRLIPVALSLVGSGLKASTVLFLGWFGPRGIASILFALVVLQRSLPAQHEILEIVVTTVALSVLLHGLTAYPASVLYARRLAAGGAGMQEHEPVSEMPLRIRSS